MNRTCVDCFVTLSFPEKTWTVQPNLAESLLIESYLFACTNLDHTNMTAFFGESDQVESNYLYMCHVDKQRKPYDRWIWQFKVQNLKKRTKFARWIKYLISVIII